MNRKYMYHLYQLPTIWDFFFNRLKSIKKLFILKKDIKKMHASLEFLKKCDEKHIFILERPNLPGRNDAKIDIALYNKCEFRYYFL